MRIQYIATGHQRSVAPLIGARLIASRIAKIVDAPAEVQPKVEISARTGKPKRQYKRRDMAAE